jgi:hypothetical protein
MWVSATLPTKVEMCPRLPPKVKVAPPKVEVPPDFPPKLNLSPDCPPRNNKSLGTPLNPLPLQRRVSVGDHLVCLNRISFSLKLRTS